MEVRWEEKIIPSEMSVSAHEVGNLLQYTHEFSILHQLVFSSALSPSINT